MAPIHIDHDTFNKYHTNGKLRLNVGYIQEVFESDGYPGHDGIVQIQKSKRDAGDQSGRKFSYRIRIHDGVFQYNALLSTDIDDQIERDCEHYTDGTFIAITEFALYSQEGGVKPSLFLTGYKVLSRHDGHLVSPEVKPRSHPGNAEEHRGYRPTIILEANWPEAEKLSGDFTENIVNPPAAKAPKRESGEEASNNRAPAPEPSRARAAPPAARKTASNNEGGIVPIGMITPYISSFKVHGMVTRKDNIRLIAAKNMKILNFELTDAHGDTIRFTAFNELAESFNGLVLENMSYFITGGSVRQANKQYNNTGHDYEITLRNESTIQSSGDVLAAPKLNLKRVPLSEIAGHGGQMVDVLAVVEKMDAEPTSFVSKQGRELIKREMELIDESGALVRLTLWGDDAQNAIVGDYLQKVVAFKGVIPREFNGGYTLGTGMGTRIIHVPDIDGVSELYEWYTEVKPSAELKMMSVTTGGNVEAPRPISLIQELQFGRDSDRGDYVNVKAMITRINGTNAMYKGCASEGCQKKVNDLDGEYRCEKCNKTSSSYKWLYMMQIELSDETGQVYATAFGDSAAKIIGKSAAEMGEMKESGNPEYDAIFDRLQFTSKMWRLRCKMETYNEEVRQKLTIYSVEDVNRDKYIENLQQFIQQMEEIQVEVF